MRHSWALGPAEIHARSELENTWLPFNVPGASPAPLGPVGARQLLFRWPFQQSSREKRPAVAPSHTVIVVTFKHPPVTTGKGEHLQ